MERNLEGKQALVTGAARGIGFAIARQLALKGAQVMIVDIDASAGENAAARVLDEGGEAVFVQADIADEASVRSLVGASGEQGNGIDILVNNAGIVSTGSIDDVGLPEWQRIVGVNLTSVFLLTKAVAPHMRDRRWGRIVNVASVAGEQGGGFLGNSCYAATKGAVIAFTKGIARELGPHNVTCNAVCPSLTDTDMTARLTDDRRAAILAGIPLGRAAQPFEIAAAVAFLASEEASFITGETLNVDGGLMRR